METWTKVLAAVGIILMLVFLFPRAREVMRNTPKGSSKDWRGVIIPLIFVVAFVYFLVRSVRP